MKKFLYSGLMALMMFFAIGSANAQKATVTLGTPTGTAGLTTWTLGTTAPDFVIAITENDGDGVTALELGTNCAVEVSIVWNEDDNTGTGPDAPIKQVLTAETTALATSTLTIAGDYDLTYRLVKMDDQTAAYEGTGTVSGTMFLRVVDPNASANPYTVMFKNGGGDDLSTEEANSVALYMPAINVVAMGSNDVPSIDAEFYYVFLAEGETAVEPTRDAYEAEGNTKVKKASAMAGTGGYGSGMNMFTIYTEDATAKTVKIKGYISPAEEGGDGPDLLSDEAAEEFVTETYTYELAFVTDKATSPALDPMGGEVEAGSTITITNFATITEGDEEGEIWYSLNGKTPLYQYMVIDENAGILPCMDGEIIVEGEPGDEFTLTVINYGYNEDIEGIVPSEVVVGTYTIAGGEVPEEPVLTVTPASNGTVGEDDVITFDGVAAFTMSVTARPEHDTMYKIKAELWTKADYESFEPAITTDWLDVTDTRMEYVDAYNGDYVVAFSLQYKSEQAGFTTVGYDHEIHFTVTNHAAPVVYPDPTLAVAAGSNGTTANGVVTFDSIPTFTMKVSDVAEGDALANYTINAEVYEKDSMTVLVTISYDAADTVALLGGIYDGEYDVVFYLERKADENVQQSQPEHLESTDNIFTIKVTNYAEPVFVDPTFAVAAAGKNEMKEGTVVFDGMAEFTMAVGEMSEGDSLKIAAVIYTKIDFDTFGQPITTNYYDVDAPKAELVGTYNGEYAVRFELQRYSLKLRDFTVVTDTVIYFNVTNYEEPVENYTVAIKPVGATMTGDKAAYNGNVVFDILVGGLKADDDMNLVTTIFTPAEYADTIAIEPKSTVKAADSVRFETSMSNGEYVALVELVRAGNREDMVVEFATLNLTVGGAAIEYSELAGVNVYPNPSNGTFNVAVPEKARIDIFGLNGAMVMSREANAGVETFSIDHSGIYFVRVMAGNKAAVKRVVVR